LLRKTMRARKASIFRARVILALAENSALPDGRATAPLILTFNLLRFIRPHLLRASTRFLKQRFVIDGLKL